MFKNKLIKGAFKLGLKRQNHSFVHPFKTSELKHRNEILYWINE